jgi:hypothetical protein
MSLLPQGQLAVHAVQGNYKPLTTMGDWATTFNDHEGTKPLAINLIEPIAIPHHDCNKAPQHLRRSLCLFNRHHNKCVGQSLLCCHSWKHCQHGCTMQQSTLLIPEAITMKIAKWNINNCTDSNCYHSWEAPKHHKTNAWLVKK